jgi:hypothetical protein
MPVVVFAGATVTLIWFLVVARLLTHRAPAPLRAESMSIR